VTRHPRRPALHRPPGQPKGVERATSCDTRLAVIGLREGQPRHQGRQAPPQDQQSAVRMVHSNVDGDRKPHQAGQGGGRKSRALQQRTDDIGSGMPEGEARFRKRSPPVEKVNASHQLHQCRCKRSLKSGNRTRCTHIRKRQFPIWSAIRKPHATPCRDKNKTSKSDLNSLPGVSCLCNFKADTHRIAACSYSGPNLGTPARSEAHRRDCPSCFPVLCVLSFLRPLSCSSLTCMLRQPPKPALVSRSYRGLPR